MKYWIFKCNPVKYNLDARLADSEPRTTWLVSRYRDEIRKGDIAFIWRTGKDRGLRAVLHLDTDPKEMAEFPHEQVYHSVQDTALQVRAIGTFTHRFQLIPSDSLKAIEELQGMSVFHGFQQATNFRITQREGERMLELIRGTQNV